jgi:hypothetical protein
MRWLMEGVEVLLGRAGCERWLLARRRHKRSVQNEAPTNRVFDCCSTRGMCAPHQKSQTPIRSAAASFTWSVHITKQGTPKFTTEVHYILATISLKFRAQITKFQGDVP